MGLSIGASMALSVPERIAQIAEHFARHDSHGYSQPNRGSGSDETITLTDGSKVAITNSDIDCSEMVRQCVDGALTGTHTRPIGYMWTGDENDKLLANGFKRLPFTTSGVRRGDVLWLKGHTGIALGGGWQADAHGDENGGITGPRKGDQTGCEVEVRSLRGSWTYIYRYAGGAVADDFIDCKYDIRIRQTCKVRSKPLVDSDDSNVTGRLHNGDVIHCDGILQKNGHDWATYIASSGNRRYVSLGEAHPWLEMVRS